MFYHYAFSGYIINAKSIASKLLPPLKTLLYEIREEGNLEIKIYTKQ